MQTKVKYIMKSYYDPTPNEIKLAGIGRRLMDIAATTSMKGLKDAEIGRYNRMASFGDTLTRVGAIFGPSKVQDILKTSGITADEATEFMKLGMKG